MQALLLDLYDTIVWTDWRAMSVHVTGRLGVSADDLLRAFDLTRRERGTGRFGSVAGDVAALVAACGLTPAPALVADLTADLVAFMQQNVRLYDDVLPAVRAFRLSGVPVAVVSNCDHVTRPVVDHLGLERETDAVVLSCDVGSLKPEPHIFEEALRRLGVAASGSCFVDDQARYLDGAAALGMRTFRIVRNPAYDDPSAGGAHPVITSLAEVR